MVVGVVEEADGIGPGGAGGGGWRRAPCASASVKLWPAGRRRDRVGEPGLGEEPGADAVAVEAGAADGEPPELGEAGREHAGEGDEQDRDDERAAARVALASSVHERGRRRVTAHAGRRPLRRAVASVDGDDAGGGAGRGIGGVERGAVAIEVGEAKAAGGDVGQDRQRLPADDALQAAARGRPAIADALLGVGIDRAVAVEVGRELDAVGGRRR